MFKKLLKNKLQSKRGFTLLETLIGISILVIAITATFSAVQTGLSSSIESREQVTAFFLAQEAVEYIRNVRDMNSLSGANWLANFAQSSADPCYSSSGKVCNIDATKSYNSGGITACSGGAGSCPYLRQDRVTTSSTYGMYGGDGTWTQSVFKREVQIFPISANEANMVVTITWSKGTFSKSFKIRELLFNWQ